MFRFSFGRSALLVAVITSFLGACSETPVAVDMNAPPVGTAFSVVDPQRFVFLIDRGNVGYAECTTPMDVNGDEVGDYVYDFGFKIDLDGGTNVNGRHTVPGFGDITVTTDANGEYWSWTSTFGIDAVISKGGNASEDSGANLYAYTEERMSDEELISNISAQGNPQQISHLAFCFDAELGVSKDAHTTFTRDYDWSITKTAAPSIQWADQDGDGNDDEGFLRVNTGNEAGVDYTVSVFSTGFTDSDWAVDGTITITNPFSVDVGVTSVTDMLSFGSTVVDNIPVNCPGPVPAEGSLACEYSADLTSGQNLLNTATVVTDGTILDANGCGEDPCVYGSGPIHGDSGTADVIFGEPTTVLDAVVDVTDTYLEFGGLQTVGLDGAVFSYTHQFGGTICDTYTETNTASYLGDAGETGSASYTVTYDVVGCDGVGVCSLTQGYWKTHSTYGPASKPDATWDLVGGPDAPFYVSGQSWYEVFWTPSQGDALYILAHQFMAATLNQLNGADTSAITTELAEAEAILTGAAPGDLKGKAGAKAKSLAQILDDYNNGLIGPGHCSDAPQG